MVGVLKIHLDIYFRYNSMCEGFDQLPVGKSFLLEILRSEYYTYKF